MKTHKITIKSHAKPAPKRIQAELAPQLALEASWAKRLAAQAVVTLMCRGGGEVPWDTKPTYSGFIR